MSQDDQRRGRSLIRTIYSGTVALRTVVTDAARARTIAAIVARYGFSQLLAGRDEASLDKRDRRKEVLGGDGSAPDAHAKNDLAERVVSMLEELGPTFVKFGQVMSTRPDLIPDEYLARMQRLQDHVSAVPVEEVRRTIETSLGKKVDELFSRFDDAPLASASIAQVHTAALPDGTEVVVKVQRPGLRPVIEADLSLLHFLLDQAVDIFPEIEAFGIKPMVVEFEHSLRRELDFDVERQSLERVRHNFRDKPRIHIPTVYVDHCSRTVLCMERLRGRKITAIDDDDERKELALVYLDATYQMLFHDGFFHGDLHPGNVFVEDDGRLGLIDFGMVGRLSRQNRERLVDILFAILSEDLENVARIWFALGRPGSSIDYAAFEAEVIDVLERNIVGRDLDQWDLGAFFSDLAAGAMRHGMRMPADFTMMFKALVTTEGLARSVARGINPVEAARPYIEALVKDRYSVDRLKQKAIVEGVRMVDLLWAMPSTFERIVEKIEAGELRVRLRHDNIEDGARMMATSLNRVALAIISAAGAVAGALTMGRGPEVFLGLSPVSLVAFAIAFAATVVFTLSMLRGR